MLRKHGIREPTSRFTRRRLHQPSSSLIFPMAFVLSLLMALVLVSYGPGGSLGCDLSLNHVLDGTEKTLTLLDQMRRLSPRFCLQDRKDFAFPQQMVEGGQLQDAQSISVLHEMLQQSFNLFDTKHSAAWDTTLLKQLCTGLLEQLADLDDCWLQVMGEEDPALGRIDPTQAVTTYFQGIHVYLNEKEYSDCAWEIVRMDIRRAFSLFINQLAR